MTTNGTLVSLYKKGVCNITAHSLDSDAAYRVYKFKKFLRNTIQELSEKEHELVLSSGLTPVEQQEIKELVALKELSVEQRDKLMCISEKIARANELIARLHEDFVEEPNIEKLSYVQWHELSKENDLDSDVEMLLEGILWSED